MSYPNARDCKHGSKRGKCDLCDMEERIAELERENAELRKDAGRYRWLREHNGIHGYGVQVAVSRPIDKTVFWVHCDAGLDAVIDAALAKIKEES